MDLTCPYFRFNGINKIPEYGYHFYKGKTVLFHYVEPWDAKERRTRTLVGRMLSGMDEAATMFDNEFRDTTGGEIASKTPEAVYAFALVWSKVTFAIWIDRKQALWFVTRKLPKNAPNVYTLAKKDSSINYRMVSKTDGLLKILPEIYKIGGLRYESPSLREAFFEVLSFIGIK